MGLEYARQLLAKGYDVALVSNRSGELDDARRNLEAGLTPTDACAPAAGGNAGPRPVTAGSETARGRIQTFCCDLARPGAAQEVVAWCDGLGLQPCILINNAGMFFMKYLGEEDVARVLSMLDLHVRTVTELCVRFGARMKAAGGGHILNVSSMTARIPAPGIAVYSASKAYLKSFGLGFSYEMKPFGVSVTTVCPAAVDTGLYPLSPRLRRIGRRIGLVQSPESLVRTALRAMFRGRRLSSPGLMNVLLPPLIHILPDRLIDRLGLRWIGRPE